MYSVLNEVNKISYRCSTVSKPLTGEVDQTSLHSVTNCFPSQTVLNCSGRACSDYIQKQNEEMNNVSTTTLTYKISSISFRNTNVHLWRLCRNDLCMHWILTQEHLTTISLVNRDSWTLACHLHTMNTTWVDVKVSLQTEWKWRLLCFSKLKEGELSYKGKILM